MMFGNLQNDLLNGAKIKRSTWPLGEYWAVRDGKLVHVLGADSKECDVAELLCVDWELYQPVSALGEAFMAEAKELAAKAAELDDGAKDLAQALERAQLLCRVEVLRDCAYRVFSA